LVSLGPTSGRRPRRQVKFIAFDAGNDHFEREFDSMHTHPMRTSDQCPKFPLAIA
jgi:hypothetical protein